MSLDLACRSGKNKGMRTNPILRSLSACLLYLFSWSANLRRARTELRRSCRYPSIPEQRKLRPGKSDLREPLRQLSRNRWPNPCPSDFSCLRERPLKFGEDPYSMFVTLTRGNVDGPPNLDESGRTLRRDPLPSGKVHETKLPGIQAHHRRLF